MNIQSALSISLMILLSNVAAAIAAETPQYTADNRLIPPSDYREWIFLTSGLDMNYTDILPSASDPSNFGNVFVNPSAYRAFLKTGLWPDKTIMVTENRVASSKGSINKNGKFQADFRGLEIHVKDEAHLPGKWAFYFSDGKQPSERRPDKALCYSCHEQHGAVDTTFVQFYPTLLEIAKAKGTLSPTYVKESALTK